MEVGRTELEVLIKLNDLISSKLAPITKQLNNMDRATGGLARQLDKISQQFERVSAAGKKLMTFGTVTLGALAGPTAAAISIEKSLTQVAKIRGYDKSQVAQMRKIIEAEAMEIPRSISEIADIVSNARGVAESDIKEYMRFISNSSIAWEVPTDQASESFSNMRNAARLTMEQTYLVGDAVNFLDNTTKAKAPDIIEYMKRTLGVVAMLKDLPTKGKMRFTFDLAALGATLKESGVQPEVAARAVSAMTTRLLQATTIKTKEFRDVLAELHIDPKDLEKSMLTEDPGAVLSAVFERVARQKNPASALARLIGEGFSDEFGKIANPEGIKRFNELRKQLSDPSKFKGAVAEEAKRVSNTTDSELKKTWNAINILGGGIGDLLLPQINELLEKTRSIIVPVTAWIDKNKELATGIVTWTAAIGGGSAALGGLLYVIGKVGGGITSLASLAIAHPIVIPVAGAILAATYLATHWDEVKGKLKKIWEETKLAFGSLRKDLEGTGWGGVLLGIVDGIVDAFKGLTKAIADAVEWVDKFLNKIGSEQRAALEKDIADYSVKTAGRYIPGTNIKHARGGIVNGPEIALIGEAGPEVVVPISSGMRPRGLALLQYAAARLGAPMFRPEIGMLMDGFMPNGGAASLLSGIPKPKPFKFPGLPKSESGVNATFSPSISVTINIDGSGDPQATADRVREQVQSVFRDQRDEFMRTLERCMTRERRLAF